MSTKRCNVGRVGLLVAALAGGQCGLALAADEPAKIEQCSKSFGTMAVAEPQGGWGYLQQYGLGSPAVLLRVMIQKSGCFDVVERGVAMQNLQQERAMMNSGDLRADSNVGQGQMQAADFVLSPTVQLAAQTTGGAGLGGLGGLSRSLGVLSALAAGLKFKEAATSLTIADVRSSLQVAAAEGKATKTDFSLGGFIGGAAGGGYTSTPEGKIVAASLLDNFNKIVLDIRDKPQLIKPSSVAGDANAGASTRAEAPMRPGQMLSARIGNVRLYADPSRESTVVGTLQRGDEAVATGEVKNGFVMVDTSNGSGWVQRTLVGPASGGGAASPAPAPQMAAAAPPPAQMPLGTSAGMRYGHFAGVIEGADAGNLRIRIANNGSITGSGALGRGGTFGVLGKFEASEGDQMTFMASTAAGNLVFMGNLERGTGEITGSWMLAAGLMGFGSAVSSPGQGGGGTFRIVRQP